MKAVAVFPGKAGSAHLAELPRPKISDVPGGRGVRVEVLRVGVDGTDRRLRTPSTARRREARPSSSWATRAWAGWRRSDRT